MSKVVLVDIDGTVAHRTDRNVFEYSKVKFDAPDYNVIEIITSLWKSGNNLIFITGRDDSCFTDTYEWLNRHCPPFIKLFMRKRGDFRSDEIVKREIFDTHIKDIHDVLCVFDDRNKVVNMWRDIGLKCVQVAEGNF